MSTLNFATTFERGASCMDANTCKSTTADVPIHKRSGTSSCRRRDGPTHTKDDEEGRSGDQSCRDGKHGSASMHVSLQQTPLFLSPLALVLGNDAWGAGGTNPEAHESVSARQADASRDITGVVCCARVLLLYVVCSKKSAPLNVGSGGVRKRGVIGERDSAISLVTPSRLSRLAFSCGLRMFRCERERAKVKVAAEASHLLEQAVLRARCCS